MVREEKSRTREREREDFEIGILENMSEMSACDTRRHTYTKSVVKARGFSFFSFICLFYARKISLSSHQSEREVTMAHAWENEREIERRERDSTGVTWEAKERRR